ncbi:hypothetical protein ERO13_A06G196000v2 [Gossypium hirsutum]|uniref:DUF7392 domain-containing protein n=3 Tax=Gossypium TaxID=3633 RepID=A0ABM3BZ14_GOSHI|nr:uncharacterized protein LOC121230857 [Gossypium hirsutum]KAB2079147.1 hypothetical protein ES319_A06G211500v1 [Gossypium barbadense]KAG4196828.1 hypothetical protein ERO13_A06G196000v2 [Gossypium hirsutum]TYI24413.1 hypothetical protein ES332_A06G232400v1 [Gossypium tomentosum]
MSCFVPFNNRNIDISIFAFKPTVVLVDELIESLKRFSVCTENLGCIQSSIFKSIHGNLIIWYGGWMKKSTETKEVLIKTLLSMLTSMSSMAILTQHSFFDSYAGESKDGSNAAKFSNGDIISLNLISSPCFNELQDVTYANLALFRSRFSKMDGATTGVCLKCQTMPMVACLYVWKSLLHCYSWILTSDFRKKELPYLDRFSPSVKYDIFWVVYVQESGGEIKN